MFSDLVETLELATGLNTSLDCKPIGVPDVLTSVRDTARRIPPTDVPIPTFPDELADKNVVPFVSNSRL